MALGITDHWLHVHAVVICKETQLKDERWFVLWSWLSVMHIYANVQANLIKSRKMMKS